MMMSRRATGIPLAMAAAVAMLSAGPAGAERLLPRRDAGPNPAPAITPPAGQTWSRHCTVTLAQPGGEVSLSRVFTDEGKLDTGDFFRWTPAGHDPSRRIAPLEIQLSYYWDINQQPEVALREIEVKVNLTTTVDLPEVADFRIQRPFPVKPHGIIGSTALSTVIFPYTPYEYNKTNGHGDLPLGDLLAYAEGFDALGWTLVSPSNVLGGSRELARGTIPIAPLREAITAMPRLREMLDRHAADPLTNCDRWPSFRSVVY